MSRVALDFPGQGMGLVVPAEQNGAPSQPGQKGAVADDDMGQTAPRGEQDHHTKGGKDHKKPGDRRVEFEDERHAEIDGEPERGAFEDNVEALITPQQQTRVVEPKLGKGSDQERHADQQQRQILRELRVGHRDAEAADRRSVTQPPAEGETGKGDERIACEQRQRRGRFTEKIRGAAHRWFGVV